MCHAFCFTLPVFVFSRLFNCSDLFHLPLISFLVYFVHVLSQFICLYLFPWSCVFWIYCSCLVSTFLFVFLVSSKLVCSWIFASACSLSLCPLSLFCCTEFSFSSSKLTLLFLHLPALCSAFWVFCKQTLGNNAVIYFMLHAAQQ